jgi:CheY-like chemotaxis protein
MQDVVDINGHAIRERTTRSLRAAFIADDRRSRELAQHLISELSTRSAQQKGRARTVSSKRILLVDDYPDALEIWGLYLRSVGYDVATAADGLEAVERAHALLPDIIVLDLELPGITGFEAAVRLRQAPDTQHIPLIAATRLWSSLASRRRSWLRLSDCSESRKHTVVGRPRLCNGFTRTGSPKDTHRRIAPSLVQAWLVHIAVRQVRMSGDGYDEGGT